FQAEDGIRDKLVTGVQTCALPISPLEPPARSAARPARPRRQDLRTRPARAAALAGVQAPATRSRPRRGTGRAGGVFEGQGRETRSEERRVGKEWRRRWVGGQERKK